MSKSEPKPDPETPLRALRKKRGFTLEHVAEQVGSDTGNLSRIEQGRQVASREMAEKLVAFYGPRSINELQIIYPERYMAEAA